MSTKYPHLFSPVRVGGVELPNRIAMMPMGVFSPRLMDYSTSAYTKDGADYYIERAKGGAGLIITGLIPITPNYMHWQINRNPEGFVKNIRYLTDGVHEQGSKIFIQLTAMSGRSTNGDTNEPAPAEIQNVWDPTTKNRSITTDEIKMYIRNFAEGAYAIKQGGGDGVEIHAVHEGYLLDQFVIANMNYRTDEYGGSLENRLRFPIEIVQAIKAKCGKEFPVSLRYSVKSYIKGFNRGALPGENFEEFGRDIDESLVIAKKLQEAGYDMLNCDNGTYDSWYWPHPPMYMPKACNLNDVAKLKAAVDIPIVCAGRFDDPDLAEEAIAQGRIDLMGMGRPLLADPEAPNKFRDGKLDEVRPCISCHQGCLGRIFQGKDISCAVNPACGREKSYAIEPAPVKKKVLVAGGGLGGMEAARVCALRGHDVELCERSGELGGVFVAASTPDFKDDDKRLLAWYKLQMKSLPITVHTSREVTEEMIRKGKYDEVFIATGAIERKLPIQGFDSPNVTYAKETLRNLSATEDYGENIVIVGGGLTGCELAYQFGRQGKTVTVVEMTETILNAFGLSAANYNMLMELLDHYHVNVIKNAVVTGYKDGVATVTETIKNYPNIANRAKLMFAVGPKGIPQVHKIKADHIVVSVGYVPDNSLYENVKGEHVHLIGDAKQPTNVMDAIWSAYEAAYKL